MINAVGDIKKSRTDKIADFKEAQGGLGVRENERKEKRDDDDGRVERETRESDRRRPNVHVLIESSGGSRVGVG